jgi:hypothetical protein
MVFPFSCSTQEGRENTTEIAELEVHRVASAASSGEPIQRPLKVCCFSDGSALTRDLVR